MYVIGAKSFHTHRSAEVSLGVHNVQSAHPCDICEFQFTGPATISEAKLPSSFIANGLVLTPDIIVDIYSTDIESPSGRGPPCTVPAV